MTKLKMMQALLDNFEQHELNAMHEIKLANRSITIRAKASPTISQIIAKNGLKLQGSPLGFLHGKLYIDDIEIKWLVE